MTPVPHTFTFDSRNALALDLWWPTVHRDGLLVLNLHGGGHDAGDKSQNQAVSIDLVNELEAVVCAPNYRITQPGSWWPNQLTDVRRALDWTLKRGPRYGIHPSKVFLLGTSAGGLMAAWGALQWDDVDGMLLLSGDLDLTLLMAAPPQDPRYPVWASAMDALFGTGTWSPSDPRLEAASPSRHVPIDYSKPAFVANSAEEDMPPEQAVAMTTALSAVGDATTPLIYDGENHGVKLWPLARPEALAFLAAQQ